MSKYTKESPGCYHSMIHILSSLSGISPYKEQDFNDIEAAKPLSHNIHFILNDVVVKPLH